jgi:ABC-type branched-subunit amino acid transport system substrate-binding protein
MKPQVTRLKDFQFDGIVFGGVYMDAVTFVKEARRQGVNQPMVCGNPVMHFNFPIRAGKAGEGVYTSSEFYHWMAKERVKKFTEEYVYRAKKKNFDPPEPLQFDVNVYDSIYMLAHVMKKNGVTNNPADLAKDRELIMKGLSTLKGFPGVASDIDFDNQSGDSSKKVYVVKAQNNEWVLVD